MAERTERRSGSRWPLVGTTVAGAVSGVWGYLLLRPPAGDPHNGLLSLGWLLLAVAWFWLLRGWVRASRWGLAAATALAGLVCALIFAAP